MNSFAVTKAPIILVSSLIIESNTFWIIIAIKNLAKDKQSSLITLPPPPVKLLSENAPVILY